MGFLPGDLKEKVDPYLRPLYDALYDMLGVEQTEKEGYRGTQSDQRIHIATTDLRLFPCPREETSSEEHHYRNSKQHLYLVRVWHMH